MSSPVYFQMKKAGMCLLRLADVVVLASLTLQLTSATAIPRENDLYPDNSQLDFAHYRNDRIASSPQEEEGVDSSRPFSLRDVLNTRVADPSQMCPRQQVILFFLTRNLSYLRSCLNDQNVSTSAYARDAVPDAETGFSAQGEDEYSSYSGRLLKRILQNMDDGTIKADLPFPSVSKKKKRSRLSIHSALTSLVDMLRHEPPRARTPSYGFHSKLLKMG